MRTSLQVGQALLLASVHTLLNYVFSFRNEMPCSASDGSKSTLPTLVQCEVLCRVSSTSASISAVVLRMACMKKGFQPWLIRLSHKVAAQLHSILIGDVSADPRCPVTSG